MRPEDQTESNECSSPVMNSSRRTGRSARGRLKLLERPDEPVDRTETGREAACRVDDLADVQTVLHLPVPGEPPGETRRQFLGTVLADEAEPHAGKTGHRVDEANSRREE